MAGKVLIAYGSKYGATKEIADKIGEAIKQEGLQVDILSADKVKDVAGYQGVVIGSAMYMGMWRKEVMDFVKNNEKVLSERPVWVFTSGPTGKGDPVQQMGGWLVPKAIKPVLDNIKPRDIAVFHGVFNKSKVSLLEKGIMKMVKADIGDFRDWDAIAKWAKGIAAELKK
jgi:menaquinone-dependent protoporphyrinogen oxidase